MPPVATDPERVEARPALWRITDRGAFERLRRDGARARAHGLSVTWAAPSDAGRTTPRVAFAVARRDGGAVARNRVRRRLRAACRKLAERGALPPGDYLLGARADVGEAPWPELLRDLDEVVARATRTAR